MNETLSGIDVKVENIEIEEKKNNRLPSNEWERRRKKKHNENSEENGFGWSRMRKDDELRDNQIKKRRHKVINREVTRPKGRERERKKVHTPRWTAKMCPEKWINKCSAWRTRDFFHWWNNRKNESDKVIMSHLKWADEYYQTFGHKRTKRKMW